MYVLEIGFDNVAVFHENVLFTLTLEGFIFTEYG
jgi:hypothetical protein